MTNSPPIQTNTTRAERIGREISQLRALGFDCDLQQDRASDTYYVIVYTQRATELEGAQPVTIYLGLDADFPAGPPDLVVTITTRTDDRKKAELPIEVESRTQRSWLAGNRLSEIVEDVIDAVWSEELRSAGPATLLDDVDPAPPGPSILSAVSSGGIRSLVGSNRRTIRGAAALGVFLLLLAALLIYRNNSRDPCAESRQVADSNPGAGNPASLRRAVDTLEGMWLRGQNGEGGSCAALAHDPNELYQADLLLAKQMLDSSDLDQAEQIYLKAQQINPESDLATQGLEEVKKARVKPLWDAAKRFHQLETPDARAQEVAALTEIQQKSPYTFDPDNGIWVTLRLHNAQIGWGDLLFAQDPSAAKDHYDIARALLVDQTVKDRQSWVDVVSRLNQAKLEAWQGLIHDLESFSQQTDPASRPKEYWLYKAHLGYGQALLAQGDARAPEALQQAVEALKLAVASGDNGAAAQLLKQQAEASLPYHLTATAQDVAAWGRQLRDAHIPAAKRPSVNLIIRTPSPGMKLILTSEGQQQELMSNGIGVASASLAGGQYTLALAGPETGNSVDMDFSKTATYYLVRVTER